VIVLAHLIGHGWRDLLVYGGGAVGIAAGFMIYSSGRAARVRRHVDGEDHPTDQTPALPLIRRDDDRCSDR
jgi:hypothetical protein